jgi:acetate---CoA ligase (ADP-forming)
VTPADRQPEEWPDLTPMFEPRTIALLGYRPDNRYCINVLKNARSMNIAPGRIVVTDRAETLNAPETLTLPDDTDLAYLLTGAWTVPTLLRETSRRGIRAAIVIAGGFNEDIGEGRRNHAALLEASTGIAVCGTSTMGLINVSAGVGLFGAPLPPLRPGDCSLITQSGGIANVLINVASQRHLGLDKAVVTGTEANVSLSDYLNYFVRSGTSRIVGIHCESVSDGNKFRSALRNAHEAGVQVVLLLSGQSEQAAVTVASHTGNLAAGRIWRDVADGYGAIVVDSIDELTESLILGSAGRRLRGSGVQLVTVSGGDCSLMTDIAHRVGTELPRPTPDVRDRLADLLPGKTIVGNPMDVGGLIRPKPAVFRGIIEALCEQSSFEVIAFRLNIPPEFDLAVADAYRVGFEIARGAGKIPVVLTRASEDVPQQWSAWFAEQRVPLNKEITRTLQAIRRAQTGADRVPPRRTDVASPHRLRLDDWAVLGLPDLAEHLTDAGLEVAAPVTVDSAAEAVAFLHRVGGPIVLKIEAAALPHKSDHGAVLVGLADDPAVADAHETLRARTQELALPDASISAQRHVVGGIEMLLGVVNDPSAGPVVTLGFGGIFAEVVADSVSRPAPIDHRGALQMIDRLRSHEILTGARNRPPADISALAHALSRLSDFAVATYDRISHVDINPIIVLGRNEGAVVVDALAIGQPSHRMAHEREGAVA